MNPWIKADNISLMQHFRHDQRHLNKKTLPAKTFYYTISIVLLIVTVLILEREFKAATIAEILTVFQRITVSKLLLYTFYTVMRAVVAYFVGLVLTIVILFLIVQHKKTENFLMPIFDILQSVPVLAFFPLIIITFATLHMPEAAAQIVLIVAMFWSVLFGAIGGYHQIPQEILDAAKIFNAGRLKLFTKVIMPAIFPSLVTGSIISFGAGWNVIIISEYINYGHTSIRLPGIGFLLSSSAGNDTGVFVAALIALVAVIFIIDRFVWRPLIVYSEKFKFE